MSIERTILRNLVKDENYSRKVIPFLKEEYFTDNVERNIFKQINAYILKYNTLPTIESLGVSLEGVKSGLSDAELVECETIINSFTAVENNNLQWLTDNTEQFCQDRAIFNAMTTALEIMTKKTKLDKGAIPQLLSDALAISFDPNIGHDYLANFEHQFEYYHRVDVKVPFDLEMFNKITNGGVNRKTINILMGGTGVGKSLMMCHMAAAAMNAGHNVLYITLELSQEEVVRRIDANLLDVPIADLDKLPKETYESKVNKLSAKTKGKLIVKEYPTASASTLHFIGLMNELNLKKNFKPDLVFIDYINICASARLRPGSANSFEYIKSITEELRGFAVKFDVPVITATQTNRAGYESSDPGLTDVAESFGMPMTADLMLAIVSNDELEKLGQYMITQLKTRYGNAANNKRFMVGVDRNKMRLYDVESSAHEGLTEHVPDTKGKSTFVNKTKEKFAALKT